MSIQFHEDKIGLWLKGTCDYKSVLDAVDHGLYVYMIDKRTTRSGSLEKWSSEEVNNIKNVSLRYPMQMYVSCAHLNLCALKHSLFWNGNVQTDEFATTLLDDLRIELRKVNPCRLVVEVGQYFNAEKAISTFVKTLDTMVLRDGDTILVQNSARFGLDTLHKVYSMVSSYTREKMGFCIHTAYCDEFDFRERGQLEAFFDYVDQLAYVYAIILGDTGHGTSEYALLGRGIIWTDTLLLEYFLHECRGRDIHVIVQSVDDLRIVRDVSRENNINDTYIE